MNNAKCNHLTLAIASNLAIAFSLYFESIFYLHADIAMCLGASTSNNICKQNNYNQCNQCNSYRNRHNICNKYRNTKIYVSI